MAPDKIDGKVRAMVRVVNFLVELDLFAVLRIAVFPVPAGGGRVGDVFVKTPVAGRIGHLSPLACHAGRISGLLQNLRQGRLIGVLDVSGRLVRQAAGAKAVAAGHDQTPRRTAQRRGVAPLKPRPGLG